VLAVLVLAMIGVSGLSADTAAVETASVDEGDAEDSEWKFRLFVLLARVEGTDARLREVRREAEEGRATQDDVKAAERDFRKAMEALERASEGTTLTQADLETRKAELRLRYAEQALADALARVDAGTADEGAVRSAERELEEARLALMETQLRAQEWESQRISLDLQDTWLDDALRLIFRRTPYSYVLSPEIRRLDLDPLTIRLKEVDLQTAVRVICDTYDLLYRKDDLVYYFFPRSDVVTIGGRTVPVLGTLEVPPVPPRPGLSFSSSPGIVSRSTIIRTDPWSTEVRDHDLDLAPRPEERPIDLQLEDAPIREAMAQLGKAAEMEIVVHEAVPEDIRITAKVYRVSGLRLLTEIVDQAGLTVVEERLIEGTDEDGHVTRVPYGPRGTVHSTPELAARRSISIFHVVPKPEIKVSGTGVAGTWETSDIQRRLDRPDLDLVRELAAETRETRAVLRLRSCPECEQLIMMPNWQFCPYCGEELPCDEEVGAEAR
jgi:hypothetical protein